MTSPEKRRPLPALVFLVALTLLTGLVWYRVLHRTPTAKGNTNPSCASSPSPSPSPTATVLPTPDLVSVLVLNSTTRSGIAGVARKALIADGFISGQPAANDDPNYGGHGLITGVAEIRYGPTATTGATLLSYYFPTATMVPTSSTTAIVTVSLGAKYTTIATAAAVKAALSAHGITLSNAAPAITPSSSASPSC